ncbi:zinc finger protein [Macleaya cordata]|uniref:RING-type E3 ubiquitin transferase n=1 Tax=Macleaya cordata TaxID=56857 RepID=A0A200QW94_MACCD|nr:zinc finger protein [Macleaya cordata]
MGVPQTQSPAHFYPQELQLKLYQAFIFSVPILFSIILLLLFYLFYLKRRRDSNLSSLPSTVNPRTTTTTLNQPTTVLPLHLEEGLKEELKEKLPIIIFDEDLRAKDTLCCVCLGEFEVREQLHQIPACKHVFHIECIHHWLCANSTCPLCRSFILPVKKLNSSVDPPPPV